MASRVIVVGSVNVDHVASVERLPSPGETVTGATFARHHGGKGGNQATAAARLGARVAFVGAVGDDPLAIEARAALADEGVDVAELASLPGASGVALILVDRQGENEIAVASGANAAVTQELVVAALDRLGIGPDDILVVGHEIPTAAVEAALRTARSVGATSILNPAPAAGLDRAVVRGADLVVPNRGELAELSGRSGAPADLAAALLDVGDGPGPRAIVVTLGRDGALVVLADASSIAVPAPPVATVDAVGAGDTFAGALAAGLVAGHDLEAAVRRAVAAASLSTTQAGARDGMPTAAELERFLGGS